MARVTVEDCIDKVDSAYDLVLVAKERAVQLNSGDAPKVKKDNDKNTVIALREIAEEKILTKDLETTAINKLRKVVDVEEEELVDQEENNIEGDDFEKLYKGEISKSGTPILPSKRARKIPEKNKNNLENELILDKKLKEESPTENENISLDELKDKENEENLKDSNISE